MVKVIYPRTAVNRHDAFHRAAFAWLYNFYARRPGVHLTSVAGWLRLALCLRPGTVFGRVDFEVLGYHDIGWAEGAGALATDRTQTHIHMYVTWFPRCRTSHKHLLATGGAFVSA